MNTNPKGSADQAESAAYPAEFAGIGKQISRPLFLKALTLFRRQMRNSHL